MPAAARGRGRPAGIDRSHRPEPPVHARRIRIAELATNRRLRRPPEDCRRQRGAVLSCWDRTRRVPTGCDGRNGGDQWGIGGSGSGCRRGAAAGAGPSGPPTTTVPDERRRRLRLGLVGQHLRAGRPHRLAVAGSQVPGIEVGTAVVPTYPRHPAALAQQALTAQAALRGRLTLGIGLSHQIVIEGMFGYSFERPARHMREYLAVGSPSCGRGASSSPGEMMRAEIGLTGAREINDVPGAARGARTVDAATGRAGGGRHGVVDDGAV